MFKIIQALFYITTYYSIKRKYRAAGNLKFNGVFIDIFGPGSLHCGTGSYISHFTRVYLAGNTCLTIGNNVSIGHNVRIYTGKIDSRAFVERGVKVEVALDVVIGNDVLIGANSYIAPGVTICDNVLIGTNSVVTASISLPGVYSGNPVSCIR
jgi:maltose O-acetyltransferase